jgi:hypothetical protein
MRKRFAAFLAAHKRKRFPVGNCYECPLAKFLGIRIAPTCADGSKYMAFERLPKWAQEFVMEFDHSPYHAESKTGAQALKILENI